MKIKLKSWHEIIIAIVLAFIISVVFFGCDKKVENPYAPDLPVSALVTTCSVDVLEGDAPLAVVFTGTASGGMQPYLYAWDFGDGSTGDGQTTSHTYSIYGQYTATLTVADNNDAQATCTIDIIVHSTHIVCFTIVGEALELGELDISLSLWDEGILGGWYVGGSLIRTWDSGRALGEGEYIITITLDRHNLVPWDTIAAFYLKFSYSFWTNDENVEVSPSIGNTGWISFEAEGDYIELKFTVKETA